MILYGVKPLPSPSPLSLVCFFLSEKRFEHGTVLHMDPPSVYPECGLPQGAMNRNSAREWTRNTQIKRERKRRESVNENPKQRNMETVGGEKEKTRKWENRMDKEEEEREKELIERRSGRECEKDLERKQRGEFGTCSQQSCITAALWDCHGNRDGLQLPLLLNAHNTHNTRNTPHTHTQSI